MCDVVPRMRPRDAFGVRLSASALDSLAHGTNPRVSPHDLKHPGNMQEYRTSIPHLSYAGIGWLIEQIRLARPICMGPSESLVYILALQFSLIFAFIMEPVENVME